MNINHIALRKLFKDFWESKDHKEVPPIPLVPKDDPTTLFTGSGMQQLVPYLLGELHPLGKRLFNVQRVLRAQDIEEVGDSCHDTFFEMMGNWSLGDYFKKEQLAWSWEFLTKVLKLPKEKLYVSVFAGTKEIPTDDESYQTWIKLGVPEEKIYKYEDNWWSRAGSPKDMPPGEPGGPDSEVFYEFTDVPHDKKFGEKCHPNCQCSRFLEIGNSVFIQYKKNQDGTFSELPKKNVDFGGGIERILAALNDDPDIFKTDIFIPIINTLEKVSEKKYTENKKSMRIVADHLKTASFLVLDGVEPSNKEQGYVMRRLIRKAFVEMIDLEIDEKSISVLSDTIMNIYPNYFKKINITKLEIIIGGEIDDFSRTIHKGTKILQSKTKIDGKLLFDLKQSYGFPIEISLELLEKWGRLADKKQLLKDYQKLLIEHQNLSRTASAQKFKGGLADQSEQTLKYHTTTHLLHQALFDVLGSDVRQEGSNITSERLRFDFYSTQRPTDQLKKVESIINNKINEQLEVSFKIIPKIEAEKIDAKSFFREKYPEMVKVYFIGGSASSPRDSFSIEFCGGPHVKNTKEIGEISIYKFEKIGSNLYRIYAK